MAGMTVSRIDRIVEMAYLRGVSWMRERANGVAVCSQGVVAVAVGNAVLDRDPVDEFSAHVR